MRILVFGSTGMLGHMVLKVLSKNTKWEVVGVSSKEFDAEQYKEIQSLSRQRLDLTSYDYVINCIGVLAGGDEEKMKKINGEFPHQLAKATKARIIHMSTDGVFSGKGLPAQAGGPYDESSPSDAADAYGKSKLEGEVNAANVLNIRTSIIGPSPYKHKGLLEWFLAQPDGTTIKGYTNHVWNGVTTLQFTQLCSKMIAQDAFGPLRDESHVLHFAPNKPVTKCELLEIFNNVFKKNVKIAPKEDPYGPIERVLKTIHEGLKRLYEYGGTIDEAVKKLRSFI